MYVYRNVSIYSGTKAGCTKIATSGVDGQLILWDLKVIHQAFNLKLLQLSTYYILYIVSVY